MALGPSESDPTGQAELSLWGHPMDGPGRRPPVRFPGKGPEAAGVEDDTGSAGSRCGRGSGNSSQGRGRSLALRGNCTPRAQSLLRSHSHAQCFWSLLSVR